MGVGGGGGLGGRGGGAGVEQHSHVGQSKAQVAAEVVKGFAPYANITAYQVGVGDGGMGTGNDDLQVAAPMLGLSLCARHLLPDRVKA